MQNKEIFMFYQAIRNLTFLNIIINLVKQKLPIHLVVAIRFQIYKFLNLIYSEKIIKNEKKKIFIFFMPDYGNLGDVAIYQAHIKFLNRYFANYYIINIPYFKTYLEFWKIKNIITENDIITMLGGGFFGDLYPEGELFRQKIVTEFKNNLIISFPQSLNYSNSKLGKLLLKRAKKVYNNHNNLILTARDNISFTFIKNNFQNSDSYLLPDIVFLESEYKINKIGQKMGICLREDQESNLNPIIRKAIYSNINEEYKIFSTKVQSNDIKILLKELKLLFEELSECKIIITDRLHAMIFAINMDIPCIALQDKFGKLLNCLTYINSININNSVSLINFDNLNQIKDLIKNINITNKIKNDFDAVEFKYAEFAETIYSRIKISP